MLKPADLRVKKKFVIFILVLFAFLIVYFIYHNITYTQNKAHSTEIASQAYQYLKSDKSSNVILRVNDTEVTYGQLMCKATILQAYHPDQKNAEKQSLLKNAFIDLSLNILEADEVKKLTESNPSVSLQLENDAQIKAYEAQVLEPQKNAKDPYTAGVAEIMYQHIDDDLAYYRNSRMVYQWINRLSTTSLSTNQTTDTSGSRNGTTQEMQETIKKLIKQCKESCKITNVDPDYAYLNTALIQQLN